MLGHNHVLLTLMHFQYPEEMRNFMYDPTSVIRGLHYDIRKGRTEHKLFANLGFFTKQNSARHFKILPGVIVWKVLICIFRTFDEARFFYSH